VKIKRRSNCDCMYCQPEGSGLSKLVSVDRLHTYKHARKEDLVCSLLNKIHARLEDSPTRNIKWSIFRARHALLDIITGHLIRHSILS